MYYGIGQYFLFTNTQQYIKDIVTTLYFGGQKCSMCFTAEIFILREKPVSASSLGSHTKLQLIGN